MSTRTVRRIAGLASAAALVTAIGVAAPNTASYRFSFYATSYTVH